MYASQKAAWVNYTRSADTGGFPCVKVRNRMTKTPTTGNEGMGQTGRRYAESEGLELSI